MDPRGLRARLTGAGCTSCGTAIPVDRIAATRPPVCEDDLIAMHRFLAGWDGDLHFLLDEQGPLNEGAAG